MTRKWHVKNSRLIYDHSPWLKIWEQDVELPNGMTIEGYILTEGLDVGMVFALTEDEQVILVEQYKHGLGENELDLPAGYLDDDDPSPLAGTQRELLEETGYAGDDWLPLGDYAINPNRSANRFYYFLARNVRRVTEPHPDPTEELALHFVPLAELRDWLDERNPSLATMTGVLLGLSALGDKTLAQAVN
jgi:8-oxo-dGTP pyrophosphatase MutT (NUDIX family)